MTFNHLLRAVRALALSFLGLLVLAHPALAATSIHTMQRFLQRGPLAIPSGDQNSTAGPQNGLFSFQVLGLRASDCIDPYEKRHAYQVEFLIAGGYDGTGRPVVTPDAFHNPNIS